MFSENLEKPDRAQQFITQFYVIPTASDFINTVPLPLMLQQFRPQIFTRVVWEILLLNVVLFLITLLLQNYKGIDLTDQFALYYPTLPEFRWYQLLTHMFMHGGFMHILLNMYGLWMLGTRLESYWGANRFTFYYFACATGAFLMHWAMGYLGVSPASPVVGASGAVVGLISAFAFLFPNTEFFMMFIPIPIKAKYLVFIMLGYDLLGAFYFHDNIAHFAHVGGMITGGAIMLYWQKFDRNRFY